jgi:malate synthase
MKRTGLILFLGLAAGMLAHTMWFDARRPAAETNLEAQLAWMRTRLHLDAGQFEQIKALHEQLSPRLKELATEKQVMANASEAFEEKRRSSGEVDFLQFASLIEKRRAVERQRGESTRALVAAALNVMTPEQRKRYLEIIGPAMDNQEAGSFH